MLRTILKNRTNRDNRNTPSNAQSHYDLSPLYDDGIHRALIRLSYQTEYSTFRNSLTAFLPSIDTKVGGMPYVDVSDEWPRCQHKFCQQRLRFKFQTTTDLNKHNLLCFYICDHCFDNQLHSNAWSVRAYQVNSMKRYGGNIQGRIDMSCYQATIHKGYSLPAWDKLSAHDADLESSFHMMEPSSPDALYRYFLHEHHIQVDLKNFDLMVGGYPSCHHQLNQQLMLNPQNRFVAQLNNCALLFGQDFCRSSQSLIIYCQDSKIKMALSQRPVSS